jgi:hypothetical protein
VQIRVILINHLHNFLPLIEDSRAHWRFSQFPCTKLISLFQLSPECRQTTINSIIQISSEKFQSLTVPTPLFIGMHSGFSEFLPWEQSGPHTMSSLHCPQCQGPGLQAAADS